MTNTDTKRDAFWERIECVWAAVSEESPRRLHALSYFYQRGNADKWFAPVLDALRDSFLSEDDGRQFHAQFELVMNEIRGMRLSCRSRRESTREKQQAFAILLGRDALAKYVRQHGASFGGSQRMLSIALEACTRLPAAQFVVSESGSAHTEATE